MNSSQLQDWLNGLETLLRPALNHNGEVSAAESRKALKHIVGNTKVLTNYLVCNYEQTDAVQPLVGQLLAIYYRLGVFRNFVIQTLPPLICVYLSAIQLGQDSLVSVFEMLFVAIYNEEILAEGPCAENFNKRVDQVRIPSIKSPSVYHDPSKLDGLPDIAELRAGNNSGILCSIQIGPYPAAENLVGENRYIVLSRLIKLISSSLQNLSLDVICDAFCEMMTDISRSSFSYKESPLRQEVLGDLTKESAFPDLQKKRRIFAPSYFYIEGLAVINFCIFNGFANSGLRALDAIHQRAIHDMAADVLLVTNSMKDILMQEESLNLIREVEEKQTTTSPARQINGD
ncbi:unnamed protein product [Bursaphelenchus xylophilus]|uniref:(pine wood nematode) hypothetical protein n=1 Tax=Bursaphelenchus xylophilus TaxID=6326 RepID=A0A1I7RQ53_BURXY|nr:unnamed protein product [Bursaphelenchus xylophilus]CAG9097179.1 unnamed protein product [Bursaphelenchus xylophilus]